MQKFVINIENFKILTILLLCLLKMHSVSSACSEDEWDCDDGSCIQLQRKCDGIIDCADKSDEIAENCIHLYRSCQDFGYTCSYGACITTSHRCNGIQDCSDNSDELVCPTSREADLQGTCGPEKLQCLKSKECINKVEICDGQRDCSDGSDESVEVCADFKCPEVGFHCGYGGCINADARCNGTNECVDGSDEAWELCGTPRKGISKRIGTKTAKRPTPTPTPTATPTPVAIRPTQSPTPTPAVGGGGCQIPPDIEDMSVKIHPLNTTIEPGSWVEDTETIHVECNNRAAISGSASLFCDNGNFNSKFPTCSTYCDGNLLKGLSTIYHCYRNGHYIEPRRCNKKILPNTEIEVVCAAGYKRTTGESRQKIRCLPNGKFDVKRQICDSECGFVQPLIESLTRKGIKVNPNDVPWHIAIYELNEGVYSFICGGSIISPRVIISAAHCFWDNAKSLQLPAENYQFVAGKYTRKYALTSDEMPQIREAESIQISKDFRGRLSYNDEDVALVQLKEPLIYNDNISSVCIVLHEGVATDYVDSGVLGSVTGYGGNNTLEQVPMKTINFHSCSKDPNAAGLTGDKFCLANEYDMSICRGDSGGGFVIKQRGINYILGIISYTPSTQLDCARDGFVSVTNVRYIKSTMMEKIKGAMQEDIDLLY